MKRGKIVFKNGGNPDDYENDAIKGFYLFLKDAKVEDSWERALREHYGFRDYKEFKSMLVNWLKRGYPKV